LTRNWCARMITGQHNRRAQIRDHGFGGFRREGPSLRPRRGSTPEARRHRGDLGPFGAPPWGGKDPSDPRKRGTPNECVRNKANPPRATGADANARGRRGSRRWDRWYKQSQFAAAGGNREKQSQFPPCGPLWSRAGEAAHAATAGPKRAEQSQFAPHRPERAPAGREHRHRGQACETKPIPPALRGRQVLLEKGVMTHLIRKGPRQNKANSRPDESGQGPAKLPATPVEPKVRNKANLPRTERKGSPAGRWGQACKTKPIFRVRPTRWIWNRQLRAQRGNPPPYVGHTLLGQSVLTDRPPICYNIVGGVGARADTGRGDDSECCFSANRLRAVTM